jgi:prolyl-tRNA editing enzyme YbaK/EbsC (Cys-tRNA(Pro) deacylase)
MAAEHPNVRQVTDALRAAGQAGSADGMRILQDDVRTAEQAAAALGVPVGAIANSLVFAASQAGEAEPRPLLALTSGAHRADVAVLAELCGAVRVGRADPDFVRRHTGQAIGGVAPVGHPAPIRTIVDRALAQYDVVWAAGGHPKSVFPTTFDALVALTGGEAADVAAS